MHGRLIAALRRAEETNNEAINDRATSTDMLSFWLVGFLYNREGEFSPFYYYTAIPDD